MNCTFPSIYKYSAVLLRPPKSSYKFQTLMSTKFRACVSTSCEIPVFRTLVNSRNFFTAEFGSFAQKNLCGKLIYSTPIRRVSSSSKKYKMGSLDSVADVEIDDGGKFKYILIEIEKGGQKKTIVRGYKWAGYHDDIYQQICDQLEPDGFTCDCPGGGRILHDNKEQTLSVYGYSMGFGRANHETTVEKLKAKYPSYKKITWSDEGY